MKSVYKKDRVEGEKKGGDMAAQNMPRQQISIKLDIIPIQAR